MVLFSIEPSRAPGHSVEPDLHNGGFEGAQQLRIDIPRLVGDVRDNGRSTAVSTDLPNIQLPHWSAIEHAENTGTQRQCYRIRVAAENNIRILP